MDLKSRLLSRPAAKFLPKRSRSVVATSRSSPSLCRRRSHDDLGSSRTFVFPVDSTLESLMRNEDTDGDKHVTIDDTGPKTISLGSDSSNGTQSFHLHGTYPLSNLLQELTAAQEANRPLLTIPYSKLHENPVSRLTRLIRTVFWPGLTRRLDADVIGLATQDPKNWTDDHTRLYVPAGAPKQLKYYTDIALSNPELHLKIETLPPKITIPEYRALCQKPGLLALDTEEYIDPRTGLTKTRAVPFVVPGGCYNEFYGWDSHFIALGLLDHNPELVRGIVRNFIFEIKHYGLIPNANRSYYLLRSQPPFLTDLSLRLYHATKEETFPDAKELLAQGLQAAIKEYHSVWMASPRLDPETGLSMYAPDGAGVPPECPDRHFSKLLQPYADKRGISLKEFTEMYNRGEISDEPDLDEYFKHDRGVRESGHDTSTRLEHKCAYIATIDLNCLLYKYETDIASSISQIFSNNFPIAPEFHLPTSPSDALSSTWSARAEKRRLAVTKYLWNESKGIFVDYHTKSRTQLAQESPTTYYSLWSSLATPHQASRQISSLHLFENLNGLSSSSPTALEHDGVHRHQWDYPVGWAPHQIMAWDGLARYGYKTEATRLVYRWLRMVLKVFVDYNGAIVEKYDMVRERDAQRVLDEFGNQGRDFHGFAREGFGWTNTSFTYGLTFLDERLKRALAVCAPWEVVERTMSGE